VGYASMASSGQNVVHVCLSFGDSCYSHAWDCWPLPFIL